MVRRVPFIHKGRTVNLDAEVDTSLPVPAPVFSLVSPDGDDETYLVRLNFATPIPAGVLRVVLILADANQHVFTSKSAAVTAGTTPTLTMGKLKDVTGAQYASVRFRSAAGLGAESVPTNVSVLVVPDPNAPLVFRALPSLVLDPTRALQQGATLGALEGTFDGALPGSAIRTLWTTPNLADDPDDEATIVPGFTFPGPIPGGLVDRAPFVRSFIQSADGLQTAYAWSAPPPGLITAIPSPDIVFAPGSVVLVDVVDIGGGLYQPVFYIDPAFLDASDFLDMQSTNPAALNVDAHWTGLTSPIENVLAVPMPLVPADWVGGDSPVMNGHNSAWTGNNNFWRINETLAQTIANAGKFWENSWALKEGRGPDVSDPRRIVRFRAGMGTQRGPLSTWHLTPSIPAEEPILVDAYWRNAERNLTMLNTAPKTHAFGHQFMRDFQACEDEPNFIFGGGDMNGTRLSDNMGASWFHGGGNGMRCFGFNSVAIDPRDHRYLLATGTMAWFQGSTGYSAFMGIWRSTDFGETWSLRQQFVTTSQEDFGHHLYAYDPASRAGAVGQRVWYFLQRLREHNQPTTGVQLWRSLDGGATWAKLGPLLPANWGNMYKLVIHPTSDRLYVATETGVRVSNTAKTSWSLIGGGLPSTRIQTFDMSPSGTEMYACVRDNGLWRSADTGATWTLKYDTRPVRRHIVDWRTTPETVYIQFNLRHPNFVVSTAGNGNGPWVEPTVTPMLGYEGDEYHSLLSRNFPNSRSGFDNMISPQAGVVIINSVGRIFRTDDAGASFRDSSLGYTGFNTASVGRESLWAQDPNDPTRYATAAQDVGVAFMHNLSYLTEKAIPDSLRAALGQPGPGSTYCVCILRTGTVLAGIGDGFSQGLCRLPVGSQTWQAVTAGPKGSGLKLIVQHPTAVAVCAGYQISKDDGLTWPITIDGIAVGVDAAGALYVMRATCTEIWKSTNWHTAATPTFTPFYSGANFNKQGLLNSACVRVSKVEANTIFIKGAGGDLFQVKNPASSFSSAVSRPMNVASYPGTPSGAVFGIADFHPDPHDPAMFYVTLWGTGYAATVLRGIIPPSGAVVYTNITVNCPKWQDLSIYVFPHTGDVIVGGGVGDWVFPPPAGYRETYGLAASRWGQLALPVKVPLAA